LGGNLTSPASEFPFNEATERRLVALMLGRLVLSLLSFGFLLLLDRMGIGPALSEVARLGLYWTLAVAFLATALSGIFFGRVRNPMRFAAVQLGADLAIVSFLVHLSGGHQSVFSFLYIAVTAYGAVLFERRSAVVAASASAAAYGAVLVVEQLGYGVAGSGVHIAVAAATWGVHVGALFVVAALASVLTNELRRTGAELDRSTHDLRRLRDLNARIVQSLNSGLLTTDSAGRVGSFNPEAERIVGMTSLDVVGALVDDVIPGAWDLLKAPAAGQQEPVRRTRLAFECEDGTSKFLGLAASALRDSQGTAIGHVVIFQDVSDVVQMEAELTRSERLAAVGEMAAKIAHEIRNPLAAISGSVQILRDDPGDTDAADSTRLMDIVVREADRLGTLITDFLGYARPRPPKSELIDLRELCEEVLDILHGACPESVSVQFRSESDRPVSIHGDADQLKQVLWNLCLNGMEAMPAGGVLRVTVANASQGAPLKGRNERSGEAPLELRPGAEVVVEDEGEGVDPKAVERLFEPFFTTKSSGTGLGLATVHRIVQGHGGQIDVQKREGQGTRFRVWLPLHSDELNG
jgi:two-component system sensor histidine kinase PilS (NtrC family)